MTTIEKMNIPIIENLNDISVNSADLFIERYRNFMHNPTDEQLNFARDMYNLVTNDTDTGKITVIPARCGIGKSKFIHALISYFVFYEEYIPRKSGAIGAVIVTDLLDRMDEYKKEPINPCSYLNYNNTDHSKYCTFISSRDNDKTAMELLIDSNYKPIVILTTQRYFSMSDELRELLFEWTYEGKKLTRQRVIFDEKPYFYDTKTIRTENFNLCDTALNEGIPSDEKDKPWLISQFRYFRDDIEKVILSNEQNNPTPDKPDIFYWKHENKKKYLTADDEFFFKKVEQYKDTITSSYSNALIDFDNFKRLLSEGTFFINPNGNDKKLNKKFDSYFTIVNDNKDKFYINENKAKFFVFDATADVDPDYNNDYVNLIDCSKYNLNTKINMMINYYDINTSKTNITKDDDTGSLLISIIKDNVLTSSITDEKILLATYKIIEEKFKSDNCETTHFGNLKGLNTYADMKKMSHIGLNRMRDIDYLFKYIATNKAVYELIKSRDDNDSRVLIKSIIEMQHGLFINNIMNDIMFKSLLADFEQNIFRTAIRNFSNENLVTINAYWKYSMYQKLNEMINYRYNPFGVIFNYKGTLPKYDEYKTMARKSSDGTSTTAQKIIKWFNEQPQGRTFKKADISKENLIAINNLNKLSKKHKVIKNLFKQSKTDKKGIYKIQ